MGLLTDPNSGSGKLTKLFVSKWNVICGLCYVAGIIWFLCLAHKNVNIGKFFDFSYYFGFLGRRNV